MAKSLFSGSAAVTGALLLSSLLFYADPSIAENLAQQNKQDNQIKTENAGTGVSAESAPALAENELPDLSVPIKADPGPPPPEPKQVMAPTLLNLPTQTFTATAYALRGRTSSGRPVARGVIAADGRVLPLGTRVRLEAGSYSGEYVVADRGGAVHGRRIDIWMPTAREARRFGRQAVKLTILHCTTPRANAHRQH